MTSTPTVDPAARFRAGPVCPARELLGGKLLEVDAEAGVARLSFEPGPEFFDARGHLAGGFQTAMIDEATAVAAVSFRRFEQLVPTVAMKTSFIRPLAPGQMVAEGRVLEDCGQVVFLEGVLRDAAGRICASASATARYVPVDRLGRQP